MTILEATVLLLVLLLGLPDFCRRIRRPGLLYPCYILAGVVAGALMDVGAINVWRQIGQFGFILLLFSVGLEIELPGKRETLIALGRGAVWMAWQVPLLVALAWVSGVPVPEAVVVALALSGTSVGMAYHLWEAHRFVDSVARVQFLEWIVAIEVIAILALAAAGPVMGGAVWWIVLIKLGGVVSAAVAAAILAVRGAPTLVRWLERGLHVQVHFLVLILFAVAALGERLGLSAPKTAFVLGMFISRSTHEEAALNHRLEPIRDRLFVPVFFFGLGTLVEPRMFLTVVFAGAVAAALLMFFMRRVVFGRFMAPVLRASPAAHVLSLPVLTIAAVAVEVLARNGGSGEAITWTLAAGLCLTLIAAVLPVTELGPLARTEPATAAPEVWSEIDAGREDPPAGADVSDRR